MLKEEIRRSRSYKVKRWGDQDFIIEEHCNTHTYTQFIAHCKLSTTPEGQFGPEGPVGPEEPVGPVGPVGLEVQVGPEGPVEPEGPVGPEDLLHQKASLGQRTWGSFCLDLPQSTQQRIIWETFTHKDNIDLFTLTYTEIKKLSNLFSLSYLFTNW